MATRYSPRIVTDGLVLCLDAANSRSYPGTGTNWADLVRSRQGVMTSAAFVSSTNDDATHRITNGTATYFDSVSAGGRSSSTTAIEFTTTSWGKGCLSYSATLEKGKIYRITFTGASTTGSGCIVRMGTGLGSASDAEAIAPSGEWFDTPAGFTAIPYAFTTSANYGGHWVGLGTEVCITFKNYDTATTTTVTNLSIVEVGGVADSGIMYFDGSGDYITFDNHSDFEIAGSSGYTVEAWVYPKSSSENYGGIIGCTQHTSGGAASSTLNWQLYRSGGGFRIYASADLSIESGGGYANNAWYQVVAVWNTALDSCSLYVNTVETANSPDESLGSTLSIGSINPRIGRADFNYHAHVGEAEFTGYMGPIRLYKNKALTTAEVQQNYIATKGRFGL